MYTDGWNKASKAYLMRSPLCVRCLSEGIAHAASLTDHIVPHRGDPELFWNESNWQSLCKRHHDIKTLTEEAAPRARPEDIPAPSCRVVLVCGSPASGKSSFVAKHRKPEDIVIDLDEIHAALTGETTHAPKRERFADALTQRNAMLSALSLQPPSRRAWVIVCAPIKERIWWERKLQPERVIVMNTSRAECEARVNSDPERAAVRGQQLDAVKRWWRAEIGA